MLVVVWGTDIEENFFAKKPDCGNAGKKGVSTSTIMISTRILTLTEVEIFLE